MPIHEFRCEKCGITEDKLVTYEHAEDPIPCEHCNSPDTTMVRATSVYFTGLVFKGKWFKTTGTY